MSSRREEKERRRQERLAADQARADAGGYHLLLHRNESDMTCAVAATVWDQRLGCPAMNDRVFDAVHAFRDEYIDKGPENVP